MNTNDIHYFKPATIYMRVQDLISELSKWKYSRYKLTNFIIGMSALLLYEFVARPYYRPHIYSHDINDFHIADTLGNSLGTIAAIFICIAIFSRNNVSAYFLIKMVTISIIFYELAQPLLGKPIDLWDITATVITGAMCLCVYYLLFKRRGLRK